MRRSTTLPAWLEAVAAHRADRAALTDLGGTVAYRDLAAAVNATAAGLLATGLRPGDLVATAMTPSTAYAVVVLGCLRAGIVVAPLNTRLTTSELRVFLEPLAARAIVADPEHAPLAGTLGPDVIELARANQPAPLAERLAPLRADATLPPVAEDAIAIVFPTGGTTGVPKGAYYEHRGVWAWLTSVLLAGPQREDDVDLFMSPFFHVTLGVGLLSRLLGGGSLVIQPRFHPPDVLAAMDAGITRLMGAPTMFAALRREPGFDAAARHRIRGITFGSSPATPSFIAQLVEDYPHAEIRTAYGATEIGPVTGMEHADLMAGRLAGVGRPLPGVRIRVVDDAGRELPRGEVGQLVVQSPWQTAGYYNRPDETAATFRPDGVHIGDLGSLDEDDWLHLAGRAKDLVISGGENVFPLEVENVLLQHPAVEQAIAYGLPDPYWGERLEATVVLRPDATLGLEELRAFARERLAGYKLPRGLRVVERLPVTPNNKPDRAAARRDALAAADPAQPAEERRR